MTSFVEKFVVPREKLLTTHVMYEPYARFPRGRCICFAERTNALRFVSCDPPLPAALSAGFFMVTM